MRQAPAGPGGLQLAGQGGGGLAQLLAALQGLQLGGTHGDGEGQQHQADHQLRQGEPGPSRRRWQAAGTGSRHGR